MRRNTVLAVLVALFAILFFAVVPSVSASAATGPTPGPTTPACNATDCAPLPPALPLTPKDPSQDVAPPVGTVPLDVNGCDPSAPCTSIDGPADLPTTDSGTLTISEHDYNMLYDELNRAQTEAFFAGLGAIISAVVIIILLFTMASTDRRHRQQLESKQATPSYIIH